MADNSTIEQVLQNCVEELFALHEQVQNDQKKFVLESATLIKASQKQLSESVDLVNKARQSAQQSEQAALEARNAANQSASRARLWKHLAFWTGLGFFTVGALLALVMWFMGKQF